MSDAPALLLVDDDTSNVLTLTALLEDEGFRVDTADSCRAARARLAGTTEYAVVLLDGTLGDGRGLDLVPVVRTTQRAARVVMVSGSAHDDSADAPPVDGAVAKGEAFDVLLACVRELLAPH